jgi:hypothetical protein
MLQLGRVLGGCTPGLMLLEVLAKVRLRVRLRGELLLLVVVLRQVSFSVLRALVLGRLVVDGLLVRCGGVLRMQLGVGQKRAWRVLGIEGLIFVLILRGLDGRLVALVLLLLLLARLLLRL